ncbi:AMP-binding protein [Aureimonas jatrophae]|uniref:Long-chain-fatty-acid--CoA ligase n=1 Tax=Aureimonas jatrophae TaxID=1166073 RepID=A0A1H0KTN2_9HYPH|nr:AMP-binding protein [Aureimonas jatrophae]MBB3948865.1 long-chain acyl-CoA synthetase [Aureimonas jatrophae]SDO59205.1 long-chain acyl-CoA synthetase [Aureimonas jatrophae]
MHPWLAHYPPGMPHELGPLPYASLAALMEEAFQRYADRPAFRFMGATMTYRELDRASARFAGYLQGLGLQRGDRVALMMPNVFQYPVAVAAVARAGLVCVNTNPLYTPRELAHQLRDSGARAIVILENMAHTLEACRAEVPVEHVVVTGVGDMLPGLKGHVVNFVLRHVKKAVPRFHLAGAVRWRSAMAREHGFQPVEITLEDPAALQYTGGTTGTAKGAILSHRNVVANALQSELWNRPATQRIPDGEQVMTVCALPLYHIFGFTVNMMLSIRMGGCNILIPNPRDIPAVIKELKRGRFHLFPAVNTLFGAIARHPDAKTVDWSHLRLSVGGGMAVQAATARLWLETTGSPICEGYGLSETSPSASCNLVTSTEFTGTIGLPLPSTVFRIIDEADRELPFGEPGEIAIAGPQVTKGYWNRPEETRGAFTADGFFRTGDIGIMDARGFVRIVDRKKDMINVSGFNVYPNEIEDVVTRMPGIAEAAAVGVADEASGEAVRLFLVRSDPSVDEAAVRAYCRERLTGYKRPRDLVFREELPKTGVGKVLRRALRD